MSQHQEEVNKDPVQACVCVAQGGQGLTGQDSRPSGRGADVTELQNMGCVCPGKITKASLNTAYISLHHSDFLSSETVIF